MGIEIALLADHPEIVVELAAALEREWPEWYGVHGDALTDLHERSRRTGLPIGFLALDDGRPIGTVTIAERSTPSHAHLSPWVIGFWVEPSRRRRGIGTDLLKAACRHARREHVTEIYTSTVTAASLLTREGWERIDTGVTEGGVTVDIFRLTLA